MKQSSDKNQKSFKFISKYSVLVFLMLSTSSIAVLHNFYSFSLTFLRRATAIVDAKMCQILNQKLYHFCTVCKNYEVDNNNTGLREALISDLDLQRSLMPYIYICHSIL